MTMATNLRPSPTTAVLAALGVLVLAGALSACQSAGEALGMSKALPDEYAVSVGPNLAVPPDVELRPPSAGSETSAGADGAAIVFGSADGAVGTPSIPTTPTNLSAGEYALLEQAHAITSNAAIRQILGEPLPSATAPAPAAPEAVPGAGVELAPSGAAPDEVIDDFFDDLIFWEGATSDIDDDAVIDAAREAERLEQNAAEGKPATEGATPVLSDGVSSP
jgi:hypothetical protein